MTLVTVALPVRHEADTLERAFRCVADQTHNELEILLVLNGSDAATTEVAWRLARGDGRARVLARPAGNLASSLNAAIGEARGEFVARMDADDSCHRERIAKQVAALSSRSELAGIGTAFEVVETGTGKVLATRRPPVAPEEIRWRLLLENVLCHGSMMLRREAVLAAGGYDESRERAQDYELWLRLNGLTTGRLGAPVRACLGCLPEVLYKYHVTARDSYSSSSMQAGVAGELLAEAWRALPRGMDSELAILLGEAMAGGDGGGEAIRGIEESLGDGPSASGLIGWLWSRWFFPAMSSRAVEVSRRSRLREVGSELRAKGVEGVTLWGAGAHTGWVMEHQGDLGLVIRGIVDDVLSGQERFGHRVARPGSVGEDDVVLLSSDWHEESLWEKSATLRERGVKVVRLYGA